MERNEFLKYINKNCKGNTPNPSIPPFNNRSFISRFGDPSFPKYNHAPNRNKLDCLLKNSYHPLLWRPLLCSERTSINALCPVSEGSWPAKRELNSRANPFRPISIYRREVGLWKCEQLSLFGELTRDFFLQLFCEYLSPGAYSFPKEQ